MQVILELLRLMQEIYIIFIIVEIIAVNYYIKKLCSYKHVLCLTLNIKCVKHIIA